MELVGAKSSTLEEFITSWNGQCSIPIRNFSAEELIKSTNNFDSQHRIDQDSLYTLYRGSFGEHSILVKRYKWLCSIYRRDTLAMAYAIRDIAITSQMSSHKNVVKLVGYCLEFKKPVLVYEGVGSTQLLSQSLYKKEGDTVDHDGLLSLKSRISIANDIASAFVYLHTAFSTPIIHRNLKPNNVIIDRCGVAKLLDFSISIAIPNGESQVQDMMITTRGHVEPQYHRTGILTEKTDVYDFGKILIELSTGQEGRSEEIGDARIREEGEGGGVVQEQPLQAFEALVSRCLEIKREDRPKMIDVAKELERIHRLIQPPSANHNPL